MEQTLRDIVAKIAETKPTFAGSAHLQDELQVDSVRAVEILFDVERTFGIKIPEERFGLVETFDDLLALVKDLKGA